jgi:hypothetical protein
MGLFRPVAGQLYQGNNLFRRAVSSLQALDSVDQVDTNIRIFGNTFYLGVAHVWFVK